MLLKYQQAQAHFAPSPQQWSSICSNIRQLFFKTNLLLCCGSGPPLISQDQLRFDLLLSPGQACLIKPKMPQTIEICFPKEDADYPQLVMAALVLTHQDLPLSLQMDKKLSNTLIYGFRLAQTIHPKVKFPPVEYLWSVEQNETDPLPF